MTIVAERRDGGGRRPVVSLGWCCLTRWIVDAAGFNQPTYPFDDVFSALPMIRHAFADDFATFLALDDLVQGPNDKTWVQRPYREMFGQDVLFAHHDMRLAENVEKFGRRVARLRAIPHGSNPLFVHIIQAEWLAGLPDLAALRDVLVDRYGEVTLAILTYGDAVPPARLEGAGAEGLILRHVRPLSQMNGLRFEEDADNEVLIAFVREAYALSDRADG